MTWVDAWRAADERLVVQRSTSEGRLRHRVISNEPRDGVVVLARFADTIAFVDHDRPATGRRLLELPRGQGEETDPDEVAVGIRELHEETGLTLLDPVVVGRLWPDSGLLGDCVTVIVGRSTGETAAGAEFRVTWVAVDDTPARIASGEVADGISISALVLAGVLGARP